ncbi:MAG: class I SAM-dependent methyltransferase [Planctomycetaceae bacterium]
MLRFLCYLLMLLLFPITVVTADEPVAEKAAESKSPQRYEVRRDHDPDGIGKFYMGREIAHVMGYAGALWLERSEREEEERLTLLIRSLKLQPGHVVADIGAGSGVISIQMAERVLPDGKVMAVDVQQEMLDRLKLWCEKYGVQNVQPVRGSERRTNLKPGSIDLAIMVDVYHEFEYPWEMLQDISRSLRPGGRLVFVEYRKEDPAVPIKEVHKMTQAQVRKEAEQPEFGLTWLETIHILPRQHVIVFQKTAGTE